MKEQQASFHVPDINRVFLRKKKGRRHFETSSLFWRHSQTSQNSTQMVGSAGHNLQTTALTIGRCVEFRSHLSPN